MEKPNAERQLTLDALRGVAALAVVAYHATENGPTVPLGFLAVDFFFILSGLVISRAYSSRLLTEMNVLDFIKARLIRLYPLFLLGLILHAARKCLKVFLDPSSGGSDFLIILGALAREVFFIPSAPIQDDLLFWINPPSWSLMFELVVNILFCTLLYRAGNRCLILLAGSSLALLACLGFSLGSFDLGSIRSTAWGGLLRALFGFACGMLISRISFTQTRRSWAVIPIMLALISILFFKRSPTVEFISIALTLPLLLVLANLFEPPAPLRSLFSLLGEVSYPIYVIHFSLLFGVGPTFRVNTILTIVVTFTVAVLMSRYFDVPARRWLNTILSAEVRLKTTA